jgi:hypothetical protein
MQDLLIGVPFAAVGLAVIVIATVFARQTTLSGRRLDEAMKMMPHAATLPMQVVATGHLPPEPNINATSRGANVEAWQDAHTN